VFEYYGKFEIEIYGRSSVVNFHSSQPHVEFERVLNSERVICGSKNPGWDNGSYFIPEARGAKDVLREIQ
jgi:hypothetical protein